MDDVIKAVMGVMAMPARRLRIDSHDEDGAYLLSQRYEIPLPSLTRSEWAGLDGRLQGLGGRGLTGLPSYGNASFGVVCHHLIAYVANKGRHVIVRNMFTIRWL